ncbi:hypothetical protein ABZP36_028530 [Zizania latifolia]
MSGSPRERVLLASPAQDSCTDRLSALPNDLILRIMSFMNARLAVRTCVLSRRWLHLWRSVPRVNAEFFEFYGATQTQSGDEVPFKRFINRLLELRDPVAPIDKFWLRYSMAEANDIQAACADANRWISHALQKNAQSVEVVVVNDTLLVDHVIFTSRFLTRIGFSTVLLDKAINPKPYAMVSRIHQSCKPDSWSMVSGCKLLWIDCVPSELTKTGEANSGI